MPVVVALLAPVAGFGLGLVIGRLVFGEWLWQTSAKSRRNTKSSRLSSRQSQPRQKPRRKAPTANSSRRGPSVCSCANCLIGLPCMRTAGPFSCGDPSCDLCHDKNGAPKYGSGSLVDFEDAVRRLQAQAVNVKAEREKRYQDHIDSLEKLPGAIRMYRTWRLFPDGSLKAMTQNHVWKPGENVTLADGKDASADSGFYGFNSLAELKEQEEAWWEASQSGEPECRNDYDWRFSTGPAEPLYWYVCGSILAYGHVKVSAKGGRCQKAVPEYIIEPAGSDPDFGMLVVNAAEKYGMKIVTVEQAEELRTGQVEYRKGKSVE